MKIINKMNTFSKELVYIINFCHNFDEENQSWK